MSLGLERVISVKQTSMAATALPLELQQQVFQYLDTRSFYLARRVCKWWHFASTDAVPLAKQLRGLPILPLVEALGPTPKQLQDLYEETSRTLMLGVEVHREHDRPASLTQAANLGFSINPRVAATSSGSKTVTLNGRIIAVFDTSGAQPEMLTRRPLNDLKETVGSGPWLKADPSSYHELAISSDGSLLAVALERTIQIYDLTADPESFTVNEYISSAAGHYICGLEFEQDDHVLRVKLSGKGAVLYLGTPPGADHQGSKATGDHWKSKAGLKHTFLDSSMIQLPSESLNDEDQLVRLCGIHLLRPFEGGYLFAAQRHGGGESSHYVLGHVKTSIPYANGPLTAELGSIAILARLESFLSSWKYTLEAPSERCNGMGLWENMPSAHEHHPRFALSENCDFLALAERDKKRIRPAPLTQLFLYRIPNEAELRKVIAKQKNRDNEGFLSKLQGGNSEQIQYSVPRIPLCLSTVPNEVTELAFTAVGKDACALSAATTDITRTWRLQDL